MPMTRTAQPRHVADVQVVIDIGALDEDQAEERLAAVVEFIESRLDRSTFQRLPGRPRLSYIARMGDVTAA